MDNRPIGIFDSGLGGLTAVRELNRLLPRERILFFGDTANIPYGMKDRETIIRLAKNDVRFLLKRNVKLVIAACGTVSSNLPEADRTGLPVPFFGIIRPAAEAAAGATMNHRIGILGTSATVKSGAFADEVLKTDPSAYVIQQECPLFVELVESGRTSPDDPCVCDVTQKYLEPLIAEHCDTVILGCTHFPLLKEVIVRYLEPGTVLIDSGKEIARSVYGFLSDNDQLNGSGDYGVTYHVSGDPEHFSRLAATFLGQDLSGKVNKTCL